MAIQTDSFGDSGTSRMVVVIVIVNNNVYGGVIMALPLQEFTRFI